MKCYVAQSDLGNHLVHVTDDEIEQVRKRFPQYHVIKLKPLALRSQLLAQGSVVTPQTFYISITHEINLSTILATILRTTIQ